jgi:thioredoxin 1
MRPGLKQYDGSRLLSSEVSAERTAFLPEPGGMMKIKQMALTLAALVLVQVPSWCQGTSPASPTGPASAKSDFAPLGEWKAAASAGNKADIAKFYSTAPPVHAETSAGASGDSSEEVNFWADLSAKGLSDFNPKVLELRTLKDGSVFVVLRVEMTVGKNPAAGEVVSTSQLWAKQDRWRIVSVRRGDLTPAPQRRLVEPAKFNTDLYPAPEEATADIASALQRAGKEKKRVILVFGGNWCIDCHVLDASFRSKDIAPLVAANYLVVHVSIGDEGNENLDIAKKYDVPIDKGVPALAVLDPNGTVVYSQKEGEFESTLTIGPEDVTQFLEKWKPTTKN